jgi:hypothetical protein
LVRMPAQRKRATGGGTHLRDVFLPVDECVQLGNPALVPVLHISGVDARPGQEGACQPRASREASVEAFGSRFLLCRRTHPLTVAVNPRGKRWPCWGQVGVGLVPDPSRPPFGRGPSPRQTASGSASVGFETVQTERQHTARSA